MNIPTESAPTTPQDPLELLLRAVDRVVNAASPSYLVTAQMQEAVMHLNNAAQYMRTVQKPDMSFKLGESTATIPVTIEVAMQEMNEGRTTDMFKANGELNAPSPAFPSILLRSCRDTISDARELAREPVNFPKVIRDEFVLECEEVLEHIKATLEAAK